MGNFSYPIPILKNAGQKELMVQKDEEILEKTELL